MKDSLQEIRVVTSFLESGGKILLLQRSERVGSYQGKWAGVSGYIEKSPDEQALIEIAEEAGLSGEDIELVRKGEPLQLEDADLATRWVIHPYLFHVNEPDKIRIDWEHKELKWVDPEDIDDYETVPALKEVLNRVI